MSLPRRAARVIRQQLRAHVAWLPLANTFELGDFGVFSGGVFNRMGNVRGLGVDFTTRSTVGAPFEFRSEGVTEARVSAEAAGRVSSALEGEAALQIGFAEADSLYLRAAEIVVSEIDELLPVAAALRRHPQWRPRYRVVHRLWTARGAIFITSQEEGAQIVLRGSLDAVVGAQEGRGDLGLTVHTKSRVGLDLIGHTGPIALGLFRVRLIDGAPDMIDFSAGPATHAAARSDLALSDVVELDEPGPDDETPDDV